MSQRIQEVRGWLMASPYLLFAAVFFFIPLLWSVVLMLSDWNLISPEWRWVGLQNFLEALQSRRVQQAFLSRSEEHTSELQSRENLVCRLLLEKKKKKNK